MRFKDITLSNVASLIEGYGKLLLDRFGILEKHEKEQLLWRASKCPPICARTGMCHYCSCDYPAKLYVNKSCNKGLSLPDLMSKEDWEKYKIENVKKITEL